MRVMGLISGGKDSCYNMMLCISAGHEIVALGHLKPKGSDELDSFMMQSVGFNIVPLMAEAMELPLVQVETEGRAVDATMNYGMSPGDEVEDLFALLSRAKEEHGVEGVASGAIASNYQRIRVEHVCNRLGLVSLAYLWKRDQTKLLEEMIDYGVKATIVKISALGLDKDVHLGKDISEVFLQLKELNEKFGLNVCGEGGEYETFTLDCRLFRHLIVIDETETVIHSNDAFAPVAYVKINKAHLERKKFLQWITQKDLVRNVPMPSPENRNIAFLNEDDITVEMDLKYPAVLPGPVKMKVSSTVSSNSSWFWVAGLYGEGHPENATKKVMSALQEHLETSGLSLRDIVTVQLYVASMGDYEAINQVYKSYFGANPPCRICVQCPLPEDITVLIECVAHRQIERSVLHVQSISAWAPANIGPYSQAVKVGSYVHVAGQIGLVPATMQPITDEYSQTVLALNHVRSVAVDIDSNVDLRNIFYGICFVVDRALIPAARRAASSRAGGDKIWSRILVAVVSGLPRKTLVEWQFVFHTLNVDEWEVLEQHSSLNGGSRIHCSIFTSPSQEVLVIANIEMDDDEIQFLLEKSLLVLRDIMQGREPVHYKVLYDASQCTADNVHQGWLQVFGEECRGSTFAAIPTYGHGCPKSPLNIVAEHRKCSSTEEDPL